MQFRGIRTLGESPKRFTNEFILRRSTNENLLYRWPIQGQKQNRNNQQVSGNPQHYPGAEGSKGTLETGVRSNLPA
jgi:hypothetical protein